MVASTGEVRGPYVQLYQWFDMALYYKHKFALESHFSLQAALSQLNSQLKLLSPHYS